jgi:hypothetical protein
MRGLGRRAVEVEQQTCLPRAIEDRGPPSRWPEDMLQRNFHCPTYNIYIHPGLFGTRIVLRNIVSSSLHYAPWSSSSPPPPPQRRKSTTSPKTSPHQSCPSPVHCRRDRSHRQSPSANPVQRTSAKGSTPRTSKRPRVDAIKNALFESSCHCAGTGRARSDNLPRRNATATRARAMGQDFRSLAPVRGLTRPPIPHPFHGL